VKNLDFFQFFDQKVGLMPYHGENIYFFAYLTSLRPSFDILISIQSQFHIEITGKIMKIISLTSGQF